MKVDIKKSDKKEKKYVAIFTDKNNKKKVSTSVLRAIQIIH